jgi:hypothetical protein
MHKIAILVVSGLFLVGACQTAKVAPDAAKLGVDFSWQGTTACSGKSPAFTVSNVPAGTKRLEFNMVDKNVPTYEHGGGSVDFTGSGSIPAGAFTYVGPCPPSGSHDYEWTVNAYDSAGATIIGVGQATAAFPPR